MWVNLDSRSGAPIGDAHVLEKTLVPMLSATLAADLPSAIASLSHSRALGASLDPGVYESLVLDCLEAGMPTYVYRIIEEGAADGLRLGDFSDQTRDLLKGKVPPEAEEYHADASSSPTTTPPLTKLLADPLPPLWVQPANSAVAFDCRSNCPDLEDNLAAAWAAIEEADAPVLLKGVGSHWPALSSWTLPALRSTMRRGMVRVSPSPQVTFCRESHPDVRAGLLTPPSRTLLMSIDEFVDRLHVGRAGRPPLLYGTDSERCYLQALAPHALMRDVDFSFLRASQQPPSFGPDEGSDPTGDAVGQSVPSVLGRLWVSAPGTVSPLHYDLTDSYLCQVRGTKRLVLWPPETSLGALDPYPPAHAMARRLRVDVTTARGSGPLDDASRREIEETAVEAVLEPGDVLYFPADWAHHTEAVGPDEDSVAAGRGVVEPSFSLGFRTDGTYLL